MATTMRLPAVMISPTTVQYHVPKFKVGSTRPTYQRRFYPSDEAKKTLEQPWLAQTDPLMPVYPYRANVHFQEANQGLYGGASIQSGNKISDGRNKGKTLRKWYPNVRVEKLRSTALNVEMAIPTTARVMRTITKCGGLDEYLLGEKPARIKELGLLGWKLRWLVLKSKSVQEKHRKQREKLGLPPSEVSPHSVESTFAAAWNDPDVRQDILAKMGKSWDSLKEKRDTWAKHVVGTLKWKVGARKLAMPTLDLHDPLQKKLPDYIEEERPVKDLPRVQEGYGIAEIVTDKAVGGMKRSKQTQGKGEQRRQTQ
ncbi:hypothetical protein LTR70_000218 [Exophiala xenobiotica]|uniref:Uncharacterized protein n=1 Tax=Lithohypha guttulata TaxID=1690604 RepID=A0ABR0K566_9EURO|nr:hypothetical protein LTR24_007073 [Lithohypha guttulata]KAK5330896.1 hypothetical protein LTR70_000218 [Exophiala xenobiotica]